MSEQHEEPARPGGRTIAIGDIHGCSDALAALIAAVQPELQDRIVLLGDVIDWGPDSRGVLDALIALEKKCRLIPLLGNHEEMCLAAFDDRGEQFVWLHLGGQATLDSYGRTSSMESIPPEHVRFIRSCLPYWETDTHIFVHANCDPDLPISEQPGWKLRERTLMPEEAMPHHSGKTIIVGHTPQLDGDVLDLGFLKCIDTECQRGGWLTALDVETGQVWQANQLREVRTTQVSV